MIPIKRSSWEARQGHPQLGNPSSSSEAHRSHNTAPHQAQVDDLTARAAVEWRKERDAAKPRDPAILGATDFALFDDMVGLAERAISFWNSLALAADRCEATGVKTYLKQIRLLTYETFKRVEALS